MQSEYDWDREPNDAEDAAAFKKLPADAWGEDGAAHSIADDDEDAKILVGSSTEADGTVTFIKIKGSKSSETYLVPAADAESKTGTNAIYTYRTSLSSNTVLEVYRGQAVGETSDPFAKVRSFSIYFKDKATNEMVQINKESRFVYAKGMLSKLKFGKYFKYSDVEYIIKSHSARSNFLCEFRRSDASKDSLPLVTTTNRTMRQPARVVLAQSMVYNGEADKAPSDVLLVNGIPTEFMDYLLMADFIYRYVVWSASNPGASPVFAVGRW